VHAHLTSDFSVLNVAENSHSAVPTIYKISGVWGNHEGSNRFGSPLVLFPRALGRAAACRRDHLPDMDCRRVLATFSATVATARPILRAAPVTKARICSSLVLQDSNRYAQAKREPEIEPDRLVN